MRLIVIATLLLLSGCVSSVCPEQLDLTEENRLTPDRYPEATGQKKVFDKSISVAGEVSALKIYEAQNGTYYVQMEPIHFAATRVYGPFASDWESDIACG